MTHIQPRDFVDREKAVDVSQSYLCEAPAGSGKTALLTQRILTLLTQVDKPESILALTFTRKAAAEMQQRVLSVLRQAEQGEEGETPYEIQQLALARHALKRDQLLKWHLMENPSRLRIATFDSLCAGLTKRLPVQSSMGFNISVTEDSARLFDEAIRNLLDALDRPKTFGLHENLSVLLRHLDNRLDQLKELLMRLLGRRDVWMPLLQYGADADERYHGLLAVLQDVLASKVSRLESLISSSFEDDCFSLLSFAVGQLKIHKPDSALVKLFNEDEKRLKRDNLNPEYWQALAGFVFTGKGELRKRLTVKEGFPPGKTKEEKTLFAIQKKRMKDFLGELAEQPKLVEALAESMHWPVLSIDEYQHHVLEALLSVLPYVVAELQLVFRSSGQVDFIEIAARAREALGSADDPSDLLLKIDQRVDHILVDEFQDTSFHQMTLLCLLSSGWLSDDHKTLFCVGDAMQSIYGFRGANVGLFLQAKQFGVGDIPLKNIRLSTNFRSDPSIVEWVNRVFQKAFPQNSDVALGAVPFSKADAFLAPCVDAQVNTVFCDSEDYKAEEAQHIVSQIAGLKEQDAEQTIAILVRNRRHAEDITMSLRCAQIGFTAVDLEPLAGNSAIKDLLSLSHALFNPLDRIAWLSCLRAPWCGMTLKDLEWVAGIGPDPVNTLLMEQIRACLSDVGGLSKDGLTRLSVFFDVMTLAMSEQKRKTARDWIKGTWEALGGYHLIRDIDIPNVEMYFDMLERLESRTSQITSEQLNLAIDQLYAQPGPGDDPNLQIMTMHKAKGLEFDAVFLPGLHHRGRNADQDLMLWYEHIDADRQERVFFAPLSAAGAERDQNYHFVNYEQKKRSNLELARLFYVACTRAKKRLYLYAHVQQTEGVSDTLKTPISGSLLSIIWPHLNASERQITSLSADARSVGRESDNISALSKLIRVPVGWTPPKNRERSPLDPYVLDHQFDNQDIVWEPNAEAVNAQRLGTAVHKALENALLLGEENLTEKYKPLFWQHYLQEMGASKAESVSIQVRHQAVLAEVSQHEKWRWLQHKRHQARVEWPLATPEGRYVLDVVVFDGEQVWVVDYKTLSRPVDQDIQTFSHKTLSNYLPVMKRYRACLNGMGYKNVRCALFLVSEGLWLEYERM